MLVFGGKKTRKEKKGLVADRCHACGAIRPFMVVDYYLVGHLYYVPLGRGKFHGTGRECTSCGNAYECTTEDYDRLVDPVKGREMSITDLLAVTNQQLAMAFRDGNLVGGESDNDDAFYSREGQIWKLAVAKEREEYPPGIANEDELATEARNSLEFIRDIATTRSNAVGCTMALVLLAAIVVPLVLLWPMLPIGGIIGYLVPLPEVGSLCNLR